MKKFGIVMFYILVGPVILVAMAYIAALIALIGDKEPPSDMFSEV